MEYLAHCIGNLTNFLLLLTFYVALFYLLFLGGVFAFFLRKQRRFELTPQLWLAAAGAFVFLVTCVTWRLMGF